MNIIPLIAVAIALLIVVSLAARIKLAQHQLHATIKAAGFKYGSWRSGSSYGYAITSYPSTPSAHAIVLAAYSNDSITRGVAVYSVYPKAAQRIRDILGSTYCGLRGDFLLYYKTAGISIEAVKNSLRSWAQTPD